jgi:hypothetical protein
MKDDLVKRLRELTCNCYDAEVIEAGKDAMDEAASRIEKLEAALAHIWAWYPINVSKPHETIDAIKDYAFAAIKGGKKND